MLKRNVFHASVTFMLLTLLASLLTISQPMTQAHAAATVMIDTTHTLTASGTFQGFGMQEDANMLWTGPNQAAGAVVPDDYNNYVRPRLEAMKPAFVRKFIDVGWFAQSQGSYTWNSTDMQGLYTDLQELQNDNVTVMLTIWRIPSWLTATANGTNTENQPAGSFPTAGTSPDYDDLWSTVITDLMKHLYGTDGSGYNFSNIKYLGAPNELEAEGSVSRLDNPYTLLENKLNNANIGSNVTLFGPDYYSTSAIATAKNDTTLNPLLGFYDYHEYDDPAEPNIVSNVTAAVSSGSGKQVWLTEFNDSADGSNGWNQLPTYAIDGVNAGLAGMSVWDAQDQVYDTNQVLDNGKWGLWGFKNTNYQTKTSYYVWSNITAHTVANSLVYSNSCDTNQCTNLRVAALNDQNGNNTILAYNLDNNSEQTQTFTYSGSSPTQTLYRYLINPSNLPTQTTASNIEGYDEVISLDNGTFSDTIPAGSFAVYSSLNPIAPSPTSNLARSATLSASSSAPYAGWSLANINDGIRNSTTANEGWSSNNQVDTNHTEYLQFDLGSTQQFHQMDFYLPNTNGQGSTVGYGMPVNFTIDVSNDGQNWTTVVAQTNYPAPTTTALQSFTFPPQQARYARIVGTSLRQSPNDGNLYRMQFTEVEIY